MPSSVVTDTETLDEILAEALADAVTLDGSLDDRNASYWSVERALLPELDAAYQRFVARVASAGTMDLAPRIGDVMPEFLLPDGRGRLFGLSSLIAEGPLVLSFNRGHWCPFCHIELKGLASIGDAVSRRGGNIVSIVPETAPFVRSMCREYRLPFPMLTDLDHGYALENGLVVPAGDEIKRLYLSYGIDFEEYQGNEAWFMPIPATFIVDRRGIVRKRFVDVDFRRRMPLQTVLAALEGLE